MAKVVIKSVKTQNSWNQKAGGGDTTGLVLISTNNVQYLFIYLFIYFNNIYILITATFVEGKIKGQIEVTGRRGRRRKKLLDELKDRRGYCQLKEEALHRTMWRNSFGRGFGPVVWQIIDYDDDDDTHYLLKMNEQQICYIVLSHIFSLTR